MPTTEELRAVANARRQENSDWAAAYSITLGWLVPANTLLVVGAAVLSLFAGASALLKYGFTTPEMTALLAFSSSVLTLLHTKFGCDKYQSECKRLVGVHRALAVEYSHLATASDETQLARDLSALNKHYSDVVGTARSWPFRLATPPTLRSMGV